MLWLAICRCYPFIAQFAVEVLREKYLSMDILLSHHDYDLFFDHKSEWHEKLGTLSQSTRNKLRQVLFKMLREARLLSVDHTIVPALLSPDMVKIISGASHLELMIYPISDVTIQLTP